MRDDIQYPNDPPDVPRWFTYAVHVWRRRRCRRYGHRFAAGSPIPSGRADVCGHCGLIVATPPYDEEAPC